MIMGVTISMITYLTNVHKVNEIIVKDFCT